MIAKIINPWLSSKGQLLVIFLSVFKPVLPPEDDVRHVIMKTMRPPGYHHNGFVATHVLGHMICCHRWPQSHSGDK